MAPGITAAGALPLCLYVSSYHPEYTWSADIERSLRRAVYDKCEVASFYMDTKRHRKIEEMQAAGLSAYKRARELQPDIIITSDDNAAKYLIEPYLVGSGIPVLFSGINWTAEEYGLPTDKVSGMLESIPIRPMLTDTLQLLNSVPSPRIAILGENTLSGQKTLHASATSHMRWASVPIVSTLMNSTNGSLDSTKHNNTTC